MKKLRKWIAAGLSLVLCAASLTGCGGSGQSKEEVSLTPSVDQPPQGRRSGGYVEEDITPGTGDELGIFYVNGVLNYFTMEGLALENEDDPESPLTPMSQWTVHWYVLNPDDSWTERTDHGFADVAAEFLKASVWPDIHMTQDGKLYWRVSQQSGGMGALIPWSVSDTYFVVEDGHAKKISDLPQGEVSLAFDEETNGMAVCKDTIVRCTTGVNLEMYDQEGRIMAAELPDLNAGWLLCGNQNGYFVRDREKKIQHYVLGGTTAEMVLDGSWTSMTDPEWHISPNAAAAEDDTLYIPIYKGANITDQENRLLRYRWDPDLVQQDAGKLTVFSLYQSESIAQVVNAMQKKSGMEVEYTYAIEAFPDIEKDDGASLDVNDVLTQLNTRLLAGEGPDIIFLDDLPAESMMEKGVFLDLSDKIPTEGLLSNLADTFRTEKGLFAVPGWCHPMVVAGPQQELDSITTAEDALEQLSQEKSVEMWSEASEDALPLFAYSFRSDMFDHFYTMFAPEIWKDGTLQEGPYRQFVQKMGSILKGNGKNMAEDPLDQLEGKSYFLPYQGSSSAYTNHRCRVWCDFVKFPSFVGDFSKNNRGKKKDSGICEVKPFVTAKGDSCVQPICLAAVNAATEHPEEAVQFVQLMLSEELQKTAREGLPVRKDTLTKVYQDALKKEKVKSNTDLTAMIEQMDVRIRSTVLHNAAARGLMSYLESGDPDQAVATAQKEVKLWLAEQ